MFRPLFALIRREYLVWIRNPFWIAAGLLTPILYLLLFGQGFNLGNSGEPAAALAVELAGAPNYFSYFSVGMIGFVTLTSALFAGTGVIFAKQLGTMQRTISTPVSRSTIFLSTLIFRGLLVIIPVFLVMGLALIFAHVPTLTGLTISAPLTAVGVFYVVAAIFILALTFTSLFLAFGFLFEKVESYFGIVNILNLPILLTSNALYPAGLAPPWLTNIEQFNPVSLAVNTMRVTFFGESHFDNHPAWVYLGGLSIWAVLIGGIALVLAHRALRTK